MSIDTPAGAVKHGFHQAAWEEPLLTQLGAPGRRGVIPPRSEPAVRERAGDVRASLPAALRRERPPALPELSQPEVVRHYTRLSQMVLGGSVANSLGLGTTTMKYNPPVHELLGRDAALTELHPQQDPATTQGALEAIYRLGEQLKAISGMAAFSLQPGGGAQAIYANALMIKAYHAERGEAERRDEIITTIYSHPVNAAAAATAGFRVVTLYPGERGHPTLEALEAVVSERTAGLMVSNPEDTGIFNPQLADFVRVVHEHGGLCSYDQANANGILGVVRARDAGFDLCHFNLHKTFAVPHGCMGGAAGAAGVREGLERFLPAPVVVQRGDRYELDEERPDSIGIVRAGLGNVQSIVKAYAWILAMGAEGLREAAHVSVLNSNYLQRALTTIPGARVSYDQANAAPRLEQARYSWEDLHAETGVTSQDVHDRMSDFGLLGYFLSHHPEIVPEPFTPEPAESYTREDLDEFAAVLRLVAEEARSAPEHVKGAPYRDATGAAIPDEARTRPAMTWRALQRVSAAAVG